MNIISAKPAVIHQKNCLHCGNCFEICPARAIMERPSCRRQEIPTDADRQK